MKKIYLFLLLSCLCLSAFSQTTVVIYSHSVAASYITGRSSSTIRGANSIVAGPGTNGYAVFDLSTIPSNATITSVVAGIDIAGLSGVGGGCNTYIYPGDLSTFTTAATLYPNLTAPAATLVNTASYGAALAPVTLPTTPATEAAVQAGIGGLISMTYECTSGTTYTITGEVGAWPSLLAGHAPYLQITYCAGPTAIDNGEPQSRLRWSYFKSKWFGHRSH